MKQEYPKPQSGFLNGWTKYWPMIVSAVIIVSGYAVMCSTVKTNKVRAMANELRITDVEKDIIKQQMSDDHLKERLDLLIKQQEQRWQEQSSVNTQVIEFLRTSH